MMDIETLINTEQSESVKDMLRAFDKYYSTIIKPDLESLKTGLKEITTRLDKTELDVKKCSDDIEINTDTITTMNFNITNVQEDLATHSTLIKKTEETLAMKLLDIQVHDRKKSLEISGIPGTRKEDEITTRNKILDLNYEVFSNTYQPTLTACHRLSAEPGSGIIVEFCNVDDKSFWQKNAHRLKKYNQEKGTKIFICQSLPPAVKLINKNLQTIRNNLPMEDKKVSAIQNIGRWPYQFIKFAAGKNENIYPTIQKEKILKKLLE